MIDLERALPLLLLEAWHASDATELDLTLDVPEQTLTVTLRRTEVLTTEDHDHDAQLDHLVDEWGRRGVALKLLEPLYLHEQRQLLEVLLHQIHREPT